MIQLIIKKKNQYKSRNTIVCLTIQAHDNIEINIDLSSSTSLGQSLTEKLSQHQKHSPSILTTLLNYTRTECVDRHQFWPSKVHDAFKFTEEKICPEDFSICIISPWMFYRVFI